MNQVFKPVLLMIYDVDSSTLKRIAFVNIIKADSL